MKVLIFYFLLLLGSVGVVFSQDMISGTVTDVNGELLPGATVAVQGTTRGTTTDFDGAFTIEATIGETLVVSYLGYASTRVKVTDKKKYVITLKEDTAQLDEIVVVGYGTQKKVNLTGALETVTFTEAVNQPVTNSGQLLYGRFSGVQLTQSSGSPGADGSSITIRGIGTFGNTTPLVVIDNIQYDDLAAFNSLAPSDIESITVLKDASASAIYGARGANGVVLVTTRKGKSDKFMVNVNSFYGIQQATVKPSFLGSLDYATLMNEKYRNEDGAGFIPRYSQAQIDAIANNSLPDQFGNTSWVDEVLTQAAIQNHNFSFSGGNQKTTYRVSLGYLGQDAIVRSKFNSQRFNLSFNLNSEVKSWLKISNVTNAFWKINKGPTGGQGAFNGDNGIIYSFQRAAPTIPAYYSNGEYGIVDGAYLGSNPSFSTQNPLRRGFFGNFRSDNINISERLGLTIKVNKNISFETSGSANIIYSTSSDFTPTFGLFDYDNILVTGNDRNSLDNGTNFSYRLLNENILRYTNTFNDVHDISFLLGHSVLYDKADGFSGRLFGFPTDNLEEFNSGAVTDPAVAGGASEEAYQSFFGRINYNYDGKYLAEFNLRYDGSSKFGPQNKYGTFPSASVGWNISKEEFMKDINAINNLKVRASWGISGNDRIGNYIFEQTYSTGEDYVLGTGLGVDVVGAAITSLANPLIRWEETQQYDIGIDLSMFNNKLELTADFFNRESTDILYQNFPIPNTLGVRNLEAQNAASMVNRGLELGINYRGRVNQAKFSFGANFTKFLLNEVTGLGDGGEETITNTNIIRIGVPFRSYYGYRAIGIFQSIDEVANAPIQFNNTNTNAGDIRYADVSGPDGVPDGIVNADDRVVIGNPNPDLLVNFNGSIEYKNFDMNFLFQGVSGVDRLLMGNGNLPMTDNRSNVLDYWINRWTPENPSTSLPRVGGQNNAEVSTFYIQDASYLRLKNFEIGYSFSKSLTSKLDIDKLRIFIGGQNLLTFTGLEYFDPEGANGSQSNRNAPLYRTFTLGLNLKL